VFARSSACLCAVLAVSALRASTLQTTRTMLALAPIPAPVVTAHAGPTIGGARQILFGAAESLVTATPFLDWVPAPGGVPMVQLAESQLLDAFAGKARCGPVAADVAALRDRNVLTLSLTAAFWGKYLTELVASGLLASPISHRSLLHSRVKDLLPVTPDNLHVNAGDWSPCESFNVAGVAGVGGVAARRAGGGHPARRAVLAVAAVAAVPGPVELVYLAKANLEILQGPDGAAPWAAIVRLAGMLGAASTRAARQDDMSTLRRVAAPLRASVARFLGVNPTADYDATLAGSLGDFLRTIVLMDGLEAHGVTSAELSAEATDSFRSSFSTADRLSVEESRFHLLEYE
jgi:hypothetical protein